MAGRGRSATRSSITTWAKGPSVSVASLARSWNRLRPTPIREAVSRVLRGESLRSIAFDFNKRGIKPAGGRERREQIDKWQGSTLRRVLISPRIAGLHEHNGEVVGKAVWPAIIDRRHP